MPTGPWAMILPKSASVVKVCASEVSDKASERRTNALAPLIRNRLRVLIVLHGLKLRIPSSPCEWA